MNLGVPLKGMTDAEQAAVAADLEAIAQATLAVTKVIGKAYGAAWTDRGLDLYNRTLRLKRQVQDKHGYGDEPSPARLLRTVPPP
jgi:hypothetical protein